MLAGRISLLISCLVFSACATPSEPRERSVSPPASISPRGLPIGDLTITRDREVLVEFEVEIGEDSASRAKGLMGVREMGKLQGMVFLDTVLHRGSFYMKNTLIPLDIAFWDSAGTIVDILQMVPCETDPCPTYKPSADYVGAIEVNVGVLADKGVRVGDSVSLSRRGALS